MEEGRIVYLIATVETLSDAQFVRNCVAYDGRSAAHHLRMKRQKAGTRIQSADDFIAQGALKSSLPGIPYLIPFTNADTVLTGDYLRQKPTERKRPVKSSTGSSLRQG